MTAEALPTSVEDLGGRRSPDDGSPRPLRMARDFPSARDVLQSDLRYLGDRLLEQDRRLGAGDRGGVEGLDAACQRLRALLVCFEDLFDADVRARVVTELSWLTSRLGDSRDLAVVQAYVASLPAGQDAAASRFLARIEQSRQFATWDLSATRASRRYLAVLDLVARPGASLVWEARADGPWRGVLVPGLRRARIALQAAELRARDAGAGSIDAALGEVRDHVRTLRYSTEAVESLDRPRYSPLVGRLVAVQDVLERHHDAAVVERVLDRGSRVVQDSAAKRWLTEAKSLVVVAKAEAVGDWYREHVDLDAFTF